MGLVEIQDSGGDPPTFLKPHRVPGLGLPNAETPNPKPRDPGVLGSLNVSRNEFLEKRKLSF